MPNNEIRYRIKKSSTNESYVSVDPRSGLLTVKKDLRLLANKKISVTYHTCLQSKIKIPRYLYCHGC